MTNIFLTSDQHFGHAKIIGLSKRPFANVDEMDEAMIEYHNQRVKPGDLVYHLGDFSFHRPDKAAWIASRLNGQKFLVWGNHDGRRYRKEASFLKNWIWTKDLADIKVTVDSVETKVVLCHYPMLTWNKSHHGSWNLHGHCHGSLKPDPNALRVDVGVDCWGYAPVHIDEVAQVMSTKNFKPVDHHGAD